MEKGVFTSSPLVPPGLISPPSTGLTCIVASPGPRIRNSLSNDSSSFSTSTAQGTSPPIKYVYLGTDDGRIIALFVPSSSAPSSRRASPTIRHTVTVQSKKPIQALQLLNGHHLLVALCANQVSVYDATSLSLHPSNATFSGVKRFTRCASTQVRRRCAWHKKQGFEYTPRLAHLRLDHLRSSIPKMSHPRWASRTT